MEFPHSNFPHNLVPGETKIKTKEHELNKDLTKLSRRELLDLKERQLNLLENKSWLLKLPDKGDKIKTLYDRAVEALEKKTEVDEAANFLKNLNLDSKDISNLEWNSTDKPQIDSDDDESDPLAVLLSTNSTNKKIVKVQPENPLITQQDLDDIKSEHLHLDPILEQMCQNEKFGSDCRFLPYKNTKPREPNEQHKERDNSAASPPETSQVIKMLSIRESIEAENSNRNIMKEVSEKHAAERLAMKMKNYTDAGLDPKPSSLSMTKYRLPCVEMEVDSDDSFESALSESEFEEVY